MIIIIEMTKKGRKTKREKKVEISRTDIQIEKLVKFAKKEEKN